MSSCFDRADEPVRETEKNQQINKLFNVICSGYALIKIN